jgi:hypothetical protein
MAAFGSFEAVKQLDAAGRVFSARKESSSKAAFVAKVVKGPNEGGSAEAVAAFRASAGLQKKLAESGQQRLAPVLEIGQTPAGGAYFVVDMYPATALSIVETKTEVTARGLAALAETVARTLIDFQSAAGRAFGNLKASHVFLTERSLTRADVFISDPAPANLPEAADSHADARGLGLVIYELVVGLPFREYLWPLRDKGNWKALGPTGGQWLQWCNGLLAPPDDPARLDLRQFLANLTGTAAPQSAPNVAAAAPAPAVSAEQPTCTLQSLLEQHYKFDTPTLRRVLSQIGQAIVDFKKSNKREYGDVKALNILLGSQQPATARITLRLPPPQNVENPIADRQGLGRVVFEMVTGLPFRDYLWPLRDRGQWSEMGSEGLRFLNWCNQLLAPPGHFSVLEIEQFLIDLNAAPRKQPAGAGLKFAVAAIFILAAGAGTYFVLTRLSPNKVAIAPVISPTTQPTAPPAPVIANQAPKMAPPPPPVTQPPVVTPPKSEPPPVVTPIAEPPKISSTPPPKPTPPPPPPVDQAALDALAKAKPVRYGIPPIDQELDRLFASTNGHTDAETLEPAVGHLHAMAQLAVEWPKEPNDLPSSLAPEDRKRILSDYHANIDSAAVSAIAALTGNDPSAAIAAIKSQDAQLKSALTAKLNQFSSVLSDASFSLNSSAYPPTQNWSAIEQRLNSPPLPDSTAEIRGKIQFVESIAACRDLNQLLAKSQAANSKATYPAIWQRYLLLASPNDSPQALADLFRRVEANLPEPSKSQIAADMSRLWSNRLDAASAAQIKPLIDLASQMHLDQNSPAYARARADLALYQLKTQIAQANSDRARTTLINTFIASVDPASDPAAAQWIQVLKNAQAPTTSPPPRDFEAVNDGSGDLVFHDRASDMRFKQLRTDPGVYLCTDEVTVGWFVNVAARDTTIDLMSKLMNLDTPSKRIGPCAWARDPNSNWITFNTSPDWLADHPDWGPQENYSPPHPPSRRSPMQYVSPLAAMYAAGMVGCRLPTASEYQAACDDSPDRDDDENVSGPNFSRLEKRVEAIDVGGFAKLFFDHFKQELGLDRAFTGPMKPDGDDVLWFRNIPSAPSPKFRDLRGNVREWVFDPTGLNYAWSEDGIKLTDDQGHSEIVSDEENLPAAFANLWDHCLHVGLSTFSSQDDKPDAAPVSADSTAKTHHYQFSDIGFRLVLDTRTSAPAADLVAVVNGLNYLRPR